MSNQDFSRGPAGRAPDDMSERATKAAKDALSSASSWADKGATTVKQTASETAATLTNEVKQVLNRQVGAGADMLAQMGRSVNRVADELEHDAPQMAGMARTVASQVEDYAHQFRQQSVDQLWQSAADLTRRQPALVFGLAALAGFFALRIVKSSPGVSAPPIQPSYSYRSGEMPYEP